MGIPTHRVVLEHGGTLAMFAVPGAVQPLARPGMTIEHALFDAEDGKTSAVLDVGLPLGMTVSDLLAELDDLFGDRFPTRVEPIPTTGEAAWRRRRRRSSHDTLCAAAGFDDRELSMVVPVGEWIDGSTARVGRRTLQVDPRMPRHLMRGLVSYWDLSHGVDAHFMERQDVVDAAIEDGVLALMATGMELDRCWARLLAPAGSQEGETRWIGGAPWRLLSVGGTKAMETSLIVVDASGPATSLSDAARHIASVSGWEVATVRRWLSSDLRALSRVGAVALDEVDEPF